MESLDDDELDPIDRIAEGVRASLPSGRIPVN